MDSPRSGTKDDQRVVAGRYTLLEALGSGGMGTVWRARDGVLGREVALKEVVFPPGISAEDRDVLRERTRREARAAAGLHHVSAVTVFDVVEDGGAPFIVMELVEAATLAEVVREQGQLSPQRAAQVGLSVLDALIAAHRQGILHRDVKPGNVLLCDHDDPAAEGRVVLTDFGIATSPGDSSITHTGLLLGSPNYIAPERARGQQPGPASDLWSLGATLFTAVEGRPPFEAGDVLATVTAVAMGEPAPMTAAGPLEDVIRGLLERDPERRLDAGTARRMLQQVARGPVSEPRPGAPAAAAVKDTTAVLPVAAVRREMDAAAPPPARVEREVAAVPAPAPAPALRPSRPVPAQRSSSRSLPLLLAGVLFLVAMVGLAALLLRGGDDPEAPTAAPVPQRSAAPEEPADEGAAEEGAADEPVAEQEPAPPEEPAQPAAPASGDGPIPPPEGWQTFTGGPGHQTAVPPSYTQGTFNGSPEYRDNSTGRTLRVSTTPPGGGKDDAVQDREDQAAAFAKRYGDYQEIDISRIDYRGYEAADWEFTYSSGGTQLHALSRVFVVDGRGYSLFFQTRASDDWDAARAEFERISQSFRPA